MKIKIKNTHTQRENVDGVRDVKKDEKNAAVKT